MGFDGLDAEVEATGDLAGAEALTDELEDLELAVTESAGGVVGGGIAGSESGGTTDVFEDACRDGRADVDAAGEDGADGFHDGATAGGFHEVPAGAG